MSAHNYYGGNEEQTCFKCKRKIKGYPFNDEQPDCPVEDTVPVSLDELLKRYSSGLVPPEDRDFFKSSQFAAHRETYPFPFHFSTTWLYDELIIWRDQAIAEALAKHDKQT